MPVPDSQQQENETEATAQVQDPADEGPTNATVKCAFCRGTGKDPFGSLSVLSDCQVCNGRGEIRVKGQVAPCAFCKGTGMQPSTTDRLHCLACGGTGVVPVVKDPVKCPACEGTGHQLMRTAKDKRPIRQRCLKCNGQKVVTQERAKRLAKLKREGMTECAFCKGTGAQPHTTDHLSCTACGGTGQVCAIKTPVKCADCNGTGRHTLQTGRGKRLMRQHCLTCKGQGAVPCS